jgi:hypothetical protein
MRKFNDHLHDDDAVWHGSWCRWSCVEVSENYPYGKCPSGCEDSEIMGPEAALISQQVAQEKYMAGLLGIEL